MKNQINIFSLVVGLGIPGFEAAEMLHQAKWAAVKVSYILRRASVYLVDLLAPPLFIIALFPLDAAPNCHSIYFPFFSEAVLVIGVLSISRIF